MPEPRSSPQSRLLFSRRSALAGAGLLALQAAMPVRVQATDMPDLSDIADRFPPVYPEFEIALEVLAETGTSIEVGEGPLGRRRIVPITGGKFRGPNLSGTIIPGGADRQRIRVDGVRELDAIYDLQADDGTVLMVRNRVLIDAERPPGGEARYARSVVTVTAPAGPHDWLNRRILLGTLDSLRPDRPYVFLRFYVVS